MNKTFKQECKIINLAIEYRGYKGDIPYAIITDLGEEELNSKYADELERFRPFLILSREMGLAIMEHQRNEKKYAMRLARGERRLDTCFDGEEIIQALAIEDEHTISDTVSDENKARESKIKISQKAMSALSPVQRQFLVRHFIDGLSVRAIARESGMPRTNAWRIIKAGCKKYKKAVESMEVA